MISIVDYKAGNLTSVLRAVQHLGYQAEITSDPNILASSERIIFPGVGHAGKAMEDLNALGLGDALKDAFKRGTPILGICLGTQIIFERSEEADVECLGLLPGEVKRFPSPLIQTKAQEKEELKIPHMGWNDVAWLVSHPVLDGLSADASFYFVHSFYPEPKSAKDIAGLTLYGISFASVVAHDNLVAVQFHPEKSGSPGLALIDNFCRWRP